MLCLSGFELYSRWVPLLSEPKKDPPPPNEKFVDPPLQ